MGQMKAWLVTANANSDQSTVATAELQLQEQVCVKFFEYDDPTSSS